MRTLTPQRRAATICAACAAIIPSSTLMMSGHPGSTPAHFIGGLIAGAAFTVCVGTFIKSRRSHCN